MEITIVEAKGRIDFSSILDLINAEWPKEFGDASDQEKIEEMENSSHEMDVSKYLLKDNLK